MEGRRNKKRQKDRTKKEFRGKEGKKKKKGVLLALNWSG